MPINYVIGDATRPIGDGNKLIVHCCNDIGGWGSGFVLAISRRWFQPEREYRAWAKSGENFLLGAVQFVQVEDDITVANMIGQHGIRGQSEGPPIRYPAIESCLKNVAQYAKDIEASVHGCRFGAGLAGGSWPEVEKIIERTLIVDGISVTIYDLPS